jgi:uncharacterized protein (DUF427 family)
MPRAIFAGETIAESSETIIVEGNHYFPQQAVKAEYLQDSGTQTVCPWKGTASYKSVVVGQQRAKDGAWYYPQPKEEAAQIAGYYAFWNGVTVEE